MTLPIFLVLEVRAAFRVCHQQHRASSRRCLSLTALRYDQRPSRAENPSKRTGNAVVPQKPPQPRLPRPPPSNKDGKTKDLVPAKDDPTALDVGRKVPVPHRVIPKAQITPELKLTPRERLHIEHMTRQQKKVEKKMVYRERLQVYHMGSFKENVLAILKVSGITSICAVTFIFAPAHWTAGTDLWLIALIWLGGFVPAFFINYATKPMISRIFLDLPTKARESPKAAMEYAQNLPRDADLDIRYIKPWALEGSIKAKVSEFEPATGNLLKPVTFRLMEKYKNMRPVSRITPTEYFVWPKTAVGSQSTNTIPGIWDTIYRQLMKKPAQRNMTKWQKPGEEGYG